MAPRGKSPRREAAQREREREMAAVEDEKRGEEALERLRTADPPLYLSPSPELSQHARAAASHLFSALLPFCPKSPVDRLLADEGFDAEQIWYQIDLLSRPLLSTMRREVRRLEREPPEVLLPAQGKAEAMKKGEGGEEGEEEEDDDGEEDEVEEEEDDDGDEDEEEEDAAVVAAAAVEEEEEEEEGEEEEEEGEGKGQGVEDRFLKIKELEEYLEKNEEEEYGQPERRKRKEKKDEEEEEEEDVEEEEDEEDGEDAEEDDLEVRYWILCRFIFLKFCALVIFMLVFKGKK